MSKVYVVTKDTDGLGREKNVYVGHDADEAKRVCDEEYENPERGPTLHAFIEVWEDGEQAGVTRAHPETTGF